MLFDNATFNAIEYTKILNLATEFVLSTKRFDDSLLWIVFFFLSSPFNNDSSNNKRILSEVSPGLLGHQQLFTSWYPLDNTTLSSFSDVMKVLDPLLLNFVEIFLFNKNVLVCFKLDVVKFNNFWVSPRHPQVLRCLVNFFFVVFIFICEFIVIYINIYIYILYI